MGCGASAQVAADAEPAPQKAPPENYDVGKAPPSPVKAAKSAAPAAAKAPAPAAPPSAPPAAAGKGARRKTTTVRRQAISAELGDSKKSAAYVPKKIDKAANISADLVVALKGHPLFESLEATLIDEIVACMVEYKHEAGAEVIKEGDPGDNFYVVAEGKLEAFMAASGDEAISEYGPKEAFGELALLYNSPRAATVKCVSASVVYGLERLAFRKLVMSHNSLAKKGVEELLEKVPIFQKAVSAILRNFLRNSPQLF